LNPKVKSSKPQHTNRFLIPIFKCVIYDAVPCYDYTTSVIEEMSINYFGGVRGTWKIGLLEGKPSQCHSVHHKSHTY
jgi:hypothetical protein